MPIQISCTGCQSKLKAPDTAAGKKIKCPKCQTVVPVPAGAASGNGAAAAAAAGKVAAKGKPEHWFLQTPDGSQYGPVERNELDQWYAEGRVSADCQLLREGQSQWQWASEVYTSLAAASSQSSASSPALALAGAAVAGGYSSPLTPLSGYSTSASMSLSPLASPKLDPLGAAPLLSSGNVSTATLPSYTTGAPMSPLGSSGLGSTNPYASPTPIGGYGGYQRTGPHPMVIVAGIFHILAGMWNSVLFLIMVIAGFVILAGGGMFAAMGAGSDDPEMQRMSELVGAFGVVGAIILFLFALLVLAYGVFQICTAIGLFRRRRWAQVTSFVFAGLGIVAMFFYAIGSLGLDPISMISLFFELAYVTVVLLGMLLPDATRDFR